MRDAELVERAQIADVLARYSQGVDQRRWDLYFSAFTDRATVRMTLSPDRTFSPDEFRSFLTDGYDGIRLSGQHRLANHLVRIDGDTATSAVEFFATTLEYSAGVDGEPVHGAAAGLYLDTLERGADGWRIVDRLLALKSLDESALEISPDLKTAIESTRDAFHTDSSDHVRFLEGALVPITLDELRDRTEISDKLVAYCQAQDQELWPLWDGIFTEDADVRMPGVSDQVFTPAQLKGFLQQFNQTRVSGQHTVSNILYDFSGDSCRTVCELTALTLQKTDEDGILTRSRSTGLYVDDFVRTADGWRIRHRTTLQKLVEIERVPYPTELIATFSLSREHGVEL